MDTDASLAHVLDLLRDGPLRPDLLLATGDLANHGSEAAYVRVRESFDALGLPWFWLPGNHDSGALMHAVIGRGRPMIRSICVGAWQIVMLDSTVAGRSAAVSARRNWRCWIACSAPSPRATRWSACITSRWRSAARGSTSRWSRMPTPCSRCWPATPARALLWGTCTGVLGRARGAAPARLALELHQFARCSEGFRLDEQAPGLRWLELHPDGRLETRVERVSGVELGYDRHSAGYL
jgi:Icc protein